MKDLGHSNTYTFSKCIYEKLLLRASSSGEGGGVKTIIIQPSIVGPFIKNPQRDGRGLPAKRREINNMSADVIINTGGHRHFSCPRTLIVNELEHSGFENLSTHNHP